MEFADRRDAGRALAGELRPFAAEDPVVVALPRGGVAVGLEVARALGAPLEILAVRKLGAPGNPELAVGAVAEDGTAVLDSHSAELVGMTEELLEATLERETAELRRRVERYRGGRSPLPLAGRAVIVVDDGMATGMTELAAVRALRKAGARRVIVAIPVGSNEAVSMLADEADEVVCARIPRRLYGVGMWYRDFAALTDEEVLELINAAAGTHGGPSELTLELDGVRVPALLLAPATPRALVLFAHGSGSSYLSPRNRSVAEALLRGGFAALLFDLLDTSESARRERTFDIPLLTERLALATRAAASDPRLHGLKLAYFGASTGAAAALGAAAAPGSVIAAVVCRGGRPDLASRESLQALEAPTRLIVGGEDREVLELNRGATALMRCAHDLVVIEGAGHLFEEPGALGQVAERALEWFERHLE